MENSINKNDKAFKEGNHIVLLEPEIPQNTGNIARTCMATGSSLHLIHPLGFSTDDKYLKRAGMDYWDQVKVFHHESWQDFISKTEKFWKSSRSLYFMTTKGAKNYSNEDFSSKKCWFVFGKESAGIPEEILKSDYQHCIRIPMKEGSRSLNLSNSAAIILYEALRQQGFSTLLSQGELRS